MKLFMMAACAVCFTVLRLALVIVCWAMQSLKSWTNGPFYRFRWTQGRWDVFRSVRFAPMQVGNYENNA